jgi:hypothetical protein
VREGKRRRKVKERDQNNKENIPCSRNFKQLRMTRTESVRGHCRGVSNVHGWKKDDEAS